MIRLIQELAVDGFPVAVTCRVLEVAPSTYYEEIEAVAHALNTRPRKVLDWKTPAEAFDEQLRLLQQPGVASTV